MKDILILVVLSVFVFNSCTQDSSNPLVPSKGNIIGKVVFYLDSSAIVNALVETVPPTSFTTTGQFGEFTINDVPTGNYSVNVTKSGYNIASSVVTVGGGKTSSVNIQIGKSPAPPQIVSPLNGSIELAISPTLIWSASIGATRYKLQVSSDSSFTSFVFNDTTITSTSKLINGLSSSTKYWWRVIAANSYGNSNPSTTMSFTFVLANTPCPGTPTVTYSGKTYNTVQIGTQCWLKENLDVGTMIQGSQEQINNSIIEKYCYDNNVANCNTYGGLYQWNEAMQYVTTPETKGICPTGWHIPTLAEFETLKAAVGNNSNALKEIGQGTGSGVGTNTSGFSALLAGYRYDVGGFYSLGSDAVFWSSTEGDASYAYYLTLYANGSYIGLYGHYKIYGFSVRCLKD